MVKTEEQIKKFRSDVVKNLETARPEDVRWLQGVIYGLDYPQREEQEDD